LLSILDEKEICCVKKAFSLAFVNENVYIRKIREKLILNLIEWIT